MFDGKSIVNTVKHPTDKHNLKTTLLKVLDDLLSAADGEAISRIVLSTTLVTNLLATESGDQTALLLLPGPGLPVDVYRLFPHSYFLKGCIDFRGRELEAIDPLEVKKAGEAIKAQGIKKVAVVGKFSNRNSSQEKEVRRIIMAQDPQIAVAIGSETAGQLNFMRRMVTTYYSIMTQSAWEHFADEIEKALLARGIDTTVDVLKADGGTMPLQISRFKPCETAFSGPAASTMGAIALTIDPKNSVVLDIGGTTVDISLLINGRPLYASKGARLLGHYTHVSAFSVRSIPLGGDSPISINQGNINVESKRRDYAACFGGEYPTVTDALNVKYQLGIGLPAQSSTKIAELLKSTGIEVETLCQAVEDIVFNRIQAAIQEMFREWENEPAYRVWEVVNGRKFDVQELIGIGAAAASIVPGLAEHMQVAYRIPEYAAVANALGACVARPTLALQVHIDTQNKVFTIDQDGLRGSLPAGRSFQMRDAQELAKHHLLELAKARGMEHYATQAEYFLEEQFNVIRGWDTVGKIYDLGIQISPGLIDAYQGVSK